MQLIRGECETDYFKPLEVVNKPYGSGRTTYGQSVDTI